MSYSDSKVAQLSHKSGESGQIKEFLHRALAIVEIKVLLLMISLAFITSYASSFLIDWKMNVINVFYKSQTKEAVQEMMEAPVEYKDFVPEVSLPLSLADDNFYSFEYTSLGFFTKSLDFIESVSREEAEEKIIQLLPRHLKDQAKRYVKAVLIICEKYQVDPLWVMSVMWTESHFKPFAKSSVGADGLMQLMPKTRKFLYKKMRKKNQLLLVEQDHFNIKDFFDFKIEHKDFKKYVLKLVNIELGVLYLKRLLRNFNYNHKHATVAYNMGPGWTKKRLNNKLPVGDKNIYLTKVMTAYRYLVRRI